MLYFILLIQLIVYNMLWVFYLFNSKLSFIKKNISFTEFSLRKLKYTRYFNNLQYPYFLHLYVC